MSSHILLSRNEIFLIPEWILDDRGSDSSPSTRERRWRNADVLSNYFGKGLSRTRSYLSNPEKKRYLVQILKPITILNSMGAENLAFVARPENPFIISVASIEFAGGAICPPEELEFFQGIGLLDLEPICEDPVQKTTVPEIFGTKAVTPVAGLPGRKFSTRRRGGLQL